ncbi:hypothetical protein HanRHA438_Chr15g0730291 [Helianthus annuus]|nr:hypothetical protein HanRHA438_Chr15g0730291 [Helianthus annuus]
MKNTTQNIFNRSSMIIKRNVYNHSRNHKNSQPFSVFSLTLCNCFLRLSHLKSYSIVLFI